MNTRQVKKFFDKKKQQWINVANVIKTIIF